MALRMARKRIRKMLNSFSKIMHMTEKVWSRHTNPLSVWTRIASTPIPFVILWFRSELSWGVWPLLGASVLWFWINPRMFPEPHKKDGWTSRSILGEQLWLSKSAPRPTSLEALLIWASLATGIAGLVCAVAGVWFYAFSATVFGVVSMMLSKLVLLIPMASMYDRGVEK